MPTMTYLQAITDGLRSEMRADERVFCMGEDIGVFGGAFKVTDGFIEEFGPDRVFADEPALLEDGDAPWSGFARKAERSGDEASGRGRA